MPMNAQIKAQGKSKYKTRTQISISLLTIIPGPFFLVTDVTSLYQTLRFLGLDQTMIHLCKTNRQQLINYYLINY